MGHSKTWLIFAFVTIAMVTSAVSADSVHLPGILQLWVYPDGETFFVNPSDELQYFNGYQLQSGYGQIHSAQWYSIQDRLIADDINFDIFVGLGALHFTEMISTPQNIAEVMVGQAYATLAPHTAFSLGYLFAGPPDVADLTFKYVYALPGGADDPAQGVYDAEFGTLEANVTFVPEPATAAFLLAGSCLLRRKR